MGAGLRGNETLLGLYIFDGTVNGYNYLQMINNFTFPQLQEHFINQFLASFSISGVKSMELQHIT